MIKVHLFVKCWSIHLILTSVKAVGTVSGLFCDDIAENPSMRKICSNDNEEDSVCTFLCHQTKSGIGMGSQDWVYFFLLTNDFWS